MSLPYPELQPEFYTDVPFKRTAAWAIDAVVICVMVLVALVVTLFVSLFVLPLVVGAISIAYRTVMLSKYGATWGMMVMALKWRRLDGRAPDQWQAFIYSAFHTGLWAILPLQVVSIVLILTTPYRQGLHDHVMGTTMLHREAPE